MADEEKFANSLDRFLFPFIDEHMDWNELAGDDEWVGVFATESGHTIRVRQVLGQHFTTTVHVDDDLVYERKNGWTHCLRPGDWCVDLYNYAKLQREDSEQDALADAIEAAKKKATAFEPL